MKAASHRRQCRPVGGIPFERGQQLVQRPHFLTGLLDENRQQFGIRIPHRLRRRAGGWRRRSRRRSQRVHCLRERFVALSQGRQSGFRPLLQRVVRDQEGIVLEGLKIAPDGGARVFAGRSGQATQTQTIVSVGELPLQRWVHVAATFDGEVATLYVEGRLDSQVALPYTMRTGEVPLTIGNTLDSHRLTDFGGDLRVDTIGQRLKGDPLDGLLDEVRLSSAARTTFESAPPR